MYWFHSLIPHSRATFYKNLKIPIGGKLSGSTNLDPKNKKSKQASKLTGQRSQRRPSARGLKQGVLKKASYNSKQLVRPPPQTKKKNTNKNSSSERWSSLPLIFLMTYLEGFLDLFWIEKNKRVNSQKQQNNSPGKQNARHISWEVQEIMFCDS